MPFGDGTGPMGGGFGQGMGGGFGGGRGRQQGGRGLGPSGDCVCPKCGTVVPHQRGVRCSEMKCPKCGSQLVRR